MKKGKADHSDILNSTIKWVSLQIMAGAFVFGLSFYAQAKIDDFNGMINENLQTESQISTEVKHPEGIKKPSRKEKRLRIVMEDEPGFSESHVAKSSANFKFEKERRRAHTPPDRRTSKRLATEMGQFEGQ